MAALFTDLSSACPRVLNLPLYALYMYGVLVSSAVVQMSGVPFKGIDWKIEERVPVGLCHLNIDTHI